MKRRKRKEEVKVLIEDETPGVRAVEISQEAHAAKEGETSQEESPETPGAGPSGSVMRKISEVQRESVSEMEEEWGREEMEDEDEEEQKKVKMKAKMAKRGPRRGMKERNGFSCDQSVNKGRL